MKKNIFVIGGAGFIGSNFINNILAKKKFNVINIDKISYSSNKNYINNKNLKNYFFYKYNIANKKKILKILNKHQPYRIINFAAYTHVDNSIEREIKYLTNNVLSLQIFLDTLKKYLKQKNLKNFKYHHISTDEVYGDVSFKSNIKFNETCKYNPKNPYSASKASADHIVKVWSNLYNINTCLTFCSNNFGPNQFIEKLIPKTILSFLNNKKMEIYDKGQNVRNWIYVKDHCAILLKILLNKNIIGEFNISTKYYFSNKNLVNKIYDLLVAKKIKTNFKNFNSFVKFVKDRPAHDRKYNIDSTKINKKVKLINFISKFDIGLSQTIDWYLANKEFYKNKKMFLQRQGLIKKN
jgi:dTDP-glucose 4,6-dehydratase